MDIDHNDNNIDNDIDNDNDICFICMCPVRVPGYFICWKHQTPVGEPHCDSFRRQCVPCMRKMLHLNESTEKRPAYVKCPTCSATTNPRFLNAEKAYIKDFRLMNKDTYNDYKCFHDECDFKGTQRELDRHLRTDCPWRRIPCEGCRMWMRSMEMEAHIKICSLYLACAICDEYIPCIQFARHLVEAHGMEQCLLCGEFFSVSSIVAHRETKCPKGPVMCGISGCENPFLRRSDLLHHYHNHLTSAITNLEKHLHYVQIIQELCTTTTTNRAND